MLFRPHSAIKWIPDSRRHIVVNTPRIVKLSSIKIGIILANWANTRAADGLAPYGARSSAAWAWHWLCRKMNPCLPWVRPLSSCAIFMPSNDRKREYSLMFPDFIPPLKGFIINVCLPDLRTPSLRLIQLCYQLSEPQRLIPVSLLAHYVILYKLPYIHTVWDTLLWGRWA